jgi:hypothetical protein
MKIWGLFLIDTDGDTCLTETLVAVYAHYPTAALALTQINNSHLMPYLSRADLWEADRTSYDPSEEVDRLSRREGIKCYIIEEMEVQE